MDFGGWILLVSIGLVLILFSLIRRRGGPGKYPEVVQYILYDVKLNLIIAENFTKYQKPRVFETTNWMMNKEKIGFLTESLKNLLKETFTLIEGFNKEIKAAKKARSESYKSLDLTKLRENLAQCRKELEDWMMTTVGKTELPPRYPSLTSFFFGDRS
jgi:hypothetical protein